MRSVLSRAVVVATIVFAAGIYLAADAAAAGPKKRPTDSGIAAPKKRPTGSGVAGSKQLSDWDRAMGYTRAGIDAWNALQGARRGGVGHRGNYGPRQGYYNPRATGRTHYPQYDPRYHSPYNAGVRDYRALPGNPPRAVDSVPGNPLPMGDDQPGAIGRIDAAFNASRRPAIINPGSTDIVLRYLLNGDEVELPPGHYQNLGGGHAWTIEFDRGGGFGHRRYSLSEGRFNFTPTKNGWDLLRKDNN